MLNGNRDGTEFMGCVVYLDFFQTDIYVSDMFVLFLCVNSNIMLSENKPSDQLIWKM